MKELKYPIKYAIMPMEEQIGWYPGLNQLEREYGVVANIVSKCYVIKSKTEYLSDGSSKTEYEVVFPYNKNKDKLSIPEYSFYNTCTNATVVDQLFDSFESAKAVAEEKNKKIFNSQMGILPFDRDFNEKFESLRKEHQERLDRYQKIEDSVERETIDMKITKTDNPALEELVIKLNESNLYHKITSILSSQEKECLMGLIETKTSQVSTDEKPIVKVKI